MAEVPEEVMNMVNDYVKRLNKEIQVKKAVLFGSYAKGSFHKDSDVDLAIFSDNFNKMRRVDGINYLLLRAMDYDLDLEPLPFTYNDYIEREGFVKEVLRDGIEINID